MKRRILLLLLIFLFPVQPVEAEPIRWVDFSVPYESLKYALDTDIATAEQELHLGWIQTLALAGCRTGGEVRPDLRKTGGGGLADGEIP